MSAPAAFLLTFTVAIATCWLITALGRTPDPRRMERARRQLQWLNDNVWGPLWLWRHRDHRPDISYHGDGWTWWECESPCHESHVRTYGEYRGRQ